MTWTGFITSELLFNHPVNVILRSSLQRFARHRGDALSLLMQTKDSFYCHRSCLPPLCCLSPPCSSHTGSSNRAKAYQASAHDLCTCCSPGIPSPSPLCLLITRATAMMGPPRVRPPEPPCLKYRIRRTRPHHHFIFSTDLSPCYSCVCLPLAGPPHKR